MHRRRDPNAPLGSSDLEVGNAFASQAAFVLANAQAYWDARLLSQNLEQRAHDQLWSGWNTTLTAPSCLSRNIR